MTVKATNNFIFFSGLPKKDEKERLLEFEFESTTSTELKNLTIFFLFLFSIPVYNVIALI